MIVWCNNIANSNNAQNSARACDWWFLFFAPVRYKISFGCYITVRSMYLMHLMRASGPMKKRRLAFTEFRLWCSVVTATLLSSVFEDWCISA